MGLFASRETGLRWFGVVWRWFGVVWWWFGANMEGLRNKNAFKFLLQLLILSQKHILSVKKVVWCGLDVVWGVSTDPRRSVEAIADHKRTRPVLLRLWPVGVASPLETTTPFSSPDYRHYLPK